MKFITAAGFRFLSLPLLEAEKGIIHAFGTRELGRNAGRVHAGIKAAFPQITELVTVHQVHGNRALLIRRDGKNFPLRRHPVNADIIIVSALGIAAAVRTADCTPVLIFDPVSRTVAAVHAGWRGTVVRAPAVAVEIMSREFGVRPENLLAGIGPCIGSCHYQVDEPVIEGIKSALGEKAPQVLSPDGPGRARLDLSAANRLLLESAGVPGRQIAEVRLCTFCHDELFFSYRREGRGVPSLYSFIALLSDERDEK